MRKSRPMSLISNLRNHARSSWASRLTLNAMIAALLLVGLFLPMAGRPANARVAWYYDCYGWDNWSDCDGDGVPNGADQCPYEYGSQAAHGCPDRDGDGVRDSWDSCPDVAGLESCSGCPGYCGSCNFTDCNHNGIADSCDLQSTTYGPQLLVNGDFESALFDGCANPCQTSCGFTLPGWNHGIYTEDLIRNLDGCGVPNPAGETFYVSLQGSVCCGCDNNGSITQSVTLLPGETYRLGLDAFVDPYDRLKIEIDGQEFIVSPETVQVYAWQRVEWSFTAMSRNTTIRLSSIGTASTPGCLGASWASIDNVTLQQRVPVAVDLNQNGRPDSCDVADGWEEDCDGNGVIDSRQGRDGLWYTVESPQVGPIGYTARRSVDMVAPPYTLGDVSLSVQMFGDFSSSSEYLKVYLNGRWIGEMGNDYWIGKNDCQWPITDYITIPRDFFNEAIKYGDSTSAIFEIVPSIAVNANQCPAGSWVKVSLWYEASVREDCNANGLLDVCELAIMPDADGNHNGIIDACENYSLVFDCPGDLDGSGVVDTGDMGMLLMNFGLAMPGDPNDLDKNGLIDTGDTALLLLGFGDCQ